MDVPEPQPVEPHHDSAGADLGSLVKMGFEPAPPEPSPEPPPPPVTNPFMEPVYETPPETPPDAA